MKTKILIFSLLLLATVAFGQSTDTTQFPTAEKLPHNANNIIKTNVTAYAFRNINLSYERNLNKYSAIGITYGFVPKGKIPYLSSFADAEQESYFNNAEISSSVFTLEYRFYLSKAGYASGFYLAPYYRYSKFHLSDAVYTLKYYGYELPIDIDGDVSGNSLGLKTGYQWLLGQKDNWVIDFTIIGGHYGFTNGNLVGTSPIPLDPQMQAALQSELNDLDIPIVKIEAKANANGATGDVSGPWAGLQFGLSLGYRF